MQGMTPRDSAIYDYFTGALATLVWPIVRAFWRRDIRAYKEEHAKRELPPWPQK